MRRALCGFLEASTEFLPEGKELDEPPRRRRIGDEAARVLSLSQAVVQVEPFRVNAAGRAKLPPYVPWKPNETLPPAGIAPFQAMLRAVTAPLEPVSEAFQELVMA
jgi:hypothetical protein